MLLNVYPVMGDISLLYIGRQSTENLLNDKHKKYKFTAANFT